MATRTRIAIGITVVIGLAVATWLIRPLFVDEVVDEGFPAAAPASADPVPSDLPLSAGAVIPDGMDPSEVEAEMAAAAASEVETAEAMPADQPTALATGSVEGADAAHQGSGTATLYALADGSRVLRLEDLDVTNGPDLRVYLAPIGADGVPDVAAGTQLGPLKGNVGNQNYDVPAAVDTDGPLAVVIYCQPFRVTFATAALT